MCIFKHSLFIVHCTLIRTPQSFLRHQACTDLLIVDIRNPKFKSLIHVTTLLISYFSHCWPRPYLGLLDVDLQILYVLLCNFGCSLNSLHQLSQVFFMHRLVAIAINILLLLTTINLLVHFSATRYLPYIFILRERDVLLLIARCVGS